MLHLSREDSADNRLIKPLPALAACYKSFIVTLISSISPPPFSSFPLVRPSRHPSAEQYSRHSWSGPVMRFKMSYAWGVHRRKQAGKATSFRQRLGSLLLPRIKSWSNWIEKGRPGIFSNLFSDKGTFDFESRVYHSIMPNLEWQGEHGRLVGGPSTVLLSWWPVQGVLLPIPQWLLGKTPIIPRTSLIRNK